MTIDQDHLDDLLRESVVLSSAIAEMDRWRVIPLAYSWADARRHDVVAEIRAIEAGQAVSASEPPILAELLLEADALDAAARWYTRHEPAPGNETWRAGRAEYVAGEIRRHEAAGAAGRDA